MKKLLCLILILSVSAFAVACQTNPSTGPTGSTQSSQPTTASSTSGTGSESTSQPTTTQATTPTTTQATTQATTQTTTQATTQATTAPVTYSLVDAYPNLSFEQPLYFAVAADSSQRCYVVERTGRIKVFDDSPAAASAGIFLDLSSLVNSSGQEQGLLGLAFHPDYLTNGFLYVNYTNTSATIIARYERQVGNPGAADKASAEILLTFSQPYANHNGGCLDFGPDGYLYIAAGDGGSAGDPQNNAQNLSNLLGKILRIDVNYPQGILPYSIPADNPFAGNSQKYRQEIYAYGLRNPWRFSFDGQGNLWAGDVGQRKREEIDLIQNGKNYGWGAYEGTLPYKTIKGVILADLVPPVWEYDHTQGYSVTGGYVYQGTQLPGLVGKYIYGDYGSGRIWALEIDASRQAHNELLLDSNLNISSFGVDASHELRIIDLGGKIYRLAIAAP